MFSKALRKATLPIIAVGMLLAGQAGAQNMDSYKFLESLKKKDGAEVEQALTKNSGLINARDAGTGETVVHLIIPLRDATWLAYLLGKRANPNAIDNRGRTPLQLAVNLGWFDGVQLLLQSGARAEVVNDAGETPLMFAVHRKSVQIARLLLEAGANPDRADSSGRSARDYAQLENAGAGMTSVFDAYKKAPAAKAKATYGPTL